MSETMTTTRAAVLTITHTHEAGTMIDGTARGDGYGGNPQGLRVALGSEHRGMVRAVVAGSPAERLEDHAHGGCAAGGRLRGGAGREPRNARLAEVEAGKIERQAARVDALDAKAERKSAAADAADANARRQLDRLPWGR